MKQTHFSDTERLTIELAKIGCNVCQANLERCISRAGLALVAKHTAEDWSWRDSPERMGGQGGR